MDDPSQPPYTLAMKTYCVGVFFNLQYLQTQDTFSPNKKIQQRIGIELLIQPIHVHVHEIARILLNCSSTSTIMHISL